MVKSVDSKVRPEEIHLNLKSPTVRCASSSLAQGTKQEINLAYRAENFFQLLINSLIMKTGEKYGKESKASSSGTFKD